MRKILYGFLLLWIGLFLVPVHAANYELEELIPVNVKTTIVTNHFSYRQFYYSYSDEDPKDNHVLFFDKIKNISEDELPISISFALFDANKKNISVINYCASNDNDEDITPVLLKGKEEITYQIRLGKDEVPKGRSLDEVRYIAIMEDNYNCKKETIMDFEGKTVDKVGVVQNNSINGDAQLFLYVVMAVGGFLIFLFLYKVLFTNAYNNMDGEDVRREFIYKNKELKDQREYDAIHNPPPVPEVVKPKTDEVMHQEEEEANKESSDLRDFYK